MGISGPPPQPTALKAIRGNPGKRPLNTIIPGFVTRNGKAIAPFGVMGGMMQPQGHVQMITRMFGAGQNPQAAIDASRPSQAQAARGQGYGMTGGYPATQPQSSPEPVTPPSGTSASVENPFTLPG